MRTILGTTFALSFSLLAVGSLVACGGGDDGGGADAAGPSNTGFVTPTASLKANAETGGVWTELGDADLGCLNTANPDTATTVEVSLATTVTDFQSGDEVPNANVTVFPGDQIDTPFGAATRADAMGKITLAIPTGTTRFGYKMTANNKLDTLLLNQIVEPGTASQTKGEIQIVSTATATALPAFIGETRTPGTGILAGALRDCQGREISNYIATVSSTKGSVTHLPGAQTYYFSEGDPSLPVRHTQASKASKTALFMVIEMEPTATAFVQAWGFPTAADLAAGDLKLISELQVPIIGDLVVTGSYEIKRAE